MSDRLLDLDTIAETACRRITESLDRIDAGVTRIEWLIDEVNWMLERQNRGGVEA